MINIHINQNSIKRIGKLGITLWTSVAFLSVSTIYLPQISVAAEQTNGKIAEANTGATEETQAGKTQSASSIQTTAGNNVSETPTTPVIPVTPAGQTQPATKPVTKAEPEATTEPTVPTTPPVDKTPESDKTVDPTPTPIPDGINPQDNLYYKNGLPLTGTGDNGLYYVQGKAFTGWLNNKYYSQGKLVTGLITINGELYNLKAGVRQTGWFTKNENTKYYFKNGIALKGLQKIDGKIVFFDPNGVQAINAWRTTGNNKWYFFGPKDGVAYTGMKKLDGGNKYFDKNGIQVKKAWVTTGNNKWYYMDAYDGKAYTGLHKMDRSYKFFDNNGVQAKNAWRTTGNNRWYFLNAYDGKVYTGLHNMDGTQKYFSKDGVQVKGQWKTTGGNRWYLFSAADGGAKHGWYMDGVNLKYFAKNGIQSKNGWAIDRGHWYHTSSGDGHVESGNGRVEKALRTGQSIIGRSPYVWGGGRTQRDINARRFDCSSFVHWAYGSAGVNLGTLYNTVTYSQKNYGSGVNYMNMKRGDIFFMDGFGHVGIYMGGGYFIHDSPGSPTGGVGISNLFDVITRDDGRKQSWNTMSDWYARRLV